MLSEASAGAGSLYLIPVPLGGDDPLTVLAPVTVETARRLDRYVAENARSARRFLKAVGHPRPLRDVAIRVLDEHNGPQDVEAALQPLVRGADCGLISEAGCPAVADPGARLVRCAHEAGVQVVPLVGPSSLLLALMASGLNGQRFAFHGYLPVDRAQRARRLKELEARAAGETQIFIETPYRSAVLFGAVLEACRSDTLLCVAAELTLPGQFIGTRTIAEWRKRPPALDGLRAVFLLLREVLPRRARQNPEGRS